MDFTKFIDSRDVAEHLRKIDYRFTAPEAAYLVYQSSRAPLEEKFTAWEYIIENYPDCSVERKYAMGQIDSLHELLRKYMDLQRRQRQAFFEDGNFVYTLLELVQYESDNGIDYAKYRHNEMICFTSFDACLSYLKQAVKSSWNDKLQQVVIKKCPVNEQTEVFLDALVLDPNLDILEVGVIDLSDEEGKIDLFYEMEFAFPTPFERGDILLDVTAGTKYGHNQDPFVLDNLHTERHSHMGGYYLRDDMLQYRDFSPNHYLKCEFLRKPLKGKLRALKPLSSFLKNKIIEETFGNTYHFILQEEDLAERRRYLTSEYPPAFLADAGITPAPDENE